MAFNFIIIIIIIINALISPATKFIYEKWWIFWNFLVMMVNDDKQCKYGKA